MANRDPSRPPRYWSPEVWRLVCAAWDAAHRLPYASADARVIDGLHQWLVRTGKAKAAPSPWWTKALALTSAVVDCVEDEGSASLLKPWAVRAETHAPAEASAAFRPLGG